MNKLERAAMQQALEALQEYRDTQMIKAPRRAITALREALDPELQFVRDWNEGKVRRVSDGKIMGVAEKAKQEPVAEVVLRSHKVGFGRTEERKDIVFLTDAEVGQKLYSAPVQQAEQEPVGDGICLTAMQHPHTCCVTVDDISEDSIEHVEQAEQKPVACIIHTEEGDYLDWNSKGYCFYTGETPLYAAPVRTKDLTDDEVMQTYTNFNLNELGEQSFMIGFARAVIAADREKNK